MNRNVSYLLCYFISKVVFKDISITLFRFTQGYYGEVYRGMLEHIFEKQQQLVAVKKMKLHAITTSSQADFDREISIMLVFFFVFCLIYVLINFYLIRPNDGHSCVEMK